MKLSIIIPLYNTEDYIEECINSIINEDITDYEIIVIDDGSMDKGVDLVEAMAKQYPQYIKLLKNNRKKGVSGARNTGLDVAKGKYIAFLDSDDIVMNNSLSKRLNYLEDNVNVNIVTGDFVAFENVDEIVKNKGYCSLTFENIGYQVKSDQHIFTKPIDFFVKYFCVIWMGAVMVRRNHIEKIGFFDESMTHGEDEELWYRLCSDITLGYLNTPMAGYRLRPESATTNLEKKYLGACTLRLKQLEDNKLIQGNKRGFRKKLGNEFVKYSCYMREKGKFKKVVQLGFNVIKASPFSVKVWKQLLAAITLKK